MLLKPLSTAFSAAQILSMKSSPSCKLLELSIHERDGLTYLLLYSHNTLTDSTNILFLNSVTEYVTSTKRFDDPLSL